MIKSMTAYSSTILNLKSYKVIIEIKCLNSKNLDINCKISSELKEKDSSIRTLISKNLQRGKIDFILYLEKDLNYNPTIINSKIVSDNIKELKIKTEDNKEINPIHTTLANQLVFDELSSRRREGNGK